MLKDILFSLIEMRAEFCGYLIIAEIELSKFFSLQAAIQNTSSLEEIERLHAMLQAGQIPGRQNGNQPG